MHTGEFLPQSLYFFLAGDLVLTHAGTQPFDPGLGEIEPSLNQSAFLPLVLQAGVLVDQTGA